MFRSDRHAEPWRLTSDLPPQRIETPRLVLRCWHPSDAPLFRTALEQSRDHISAWIAPALDEPSELAAIEQRLTTFRTEFLAGIRFVYAIFDAEETEVLGEAGLLPRIGRGALEIGYWVHVDRVGEGIATEAAHALTVAGLALPEVEHIRIHCDPANAPSAAVPRKLGYRLLDALHDESAGPEPDGRGRLLFELSKNG